MKFHWGWKNWAGNHRSDAAVVTPRSLDQLVEAVRKPPHAETLERAKQIRPAGGSYSWAPLIPDGELIIDMSRLDAELDPDEHPRNVIEVECGMTIEQLTKKVHARGMTLVSPTLFPRPTVGGAIAAGCHGTDSGAGGFADQLLEMTIVTHDGELRTVKRGDPDMPAAKVALGTLGIIYSVKLELVPQYNVITELRKLPVDTVIGGLPEILETYEFVELFWFPFQDEMWVYLMNRTDAPADPKTIWTRLRTALDTAIENLGGDKVIPWLASHMPGLTPPLLRIASRMAHTEGVTIQSADDAFHFQHSYPKCWDCSYSFPTEHAARAWREAMELVDQYASAGLYPVNLAVHGRFTADSDAWLAPDHGRNTAYVEIVTASGTPHWRSFFRETERRWTKIPGARPHWAKLYWEVDRLHEQYERWDDFLAVRERWDPDRVFLNEFLERQVFQLPPRDEARSA